MKKIAIDLVPIRVGEGGTGSGIWTYARELLHAMDRQIPEGMELACFVNEGQLPYLLDLNNIRLISFSGGTKKGIISRLLWMHVRLPLACRKHGVDVLHKLATDNPWMCPAQRVTTVHDFYYEYLMEQRPRDHVRFYERLENLYFTWVTRVCFRKSDAIIAVSGATRDEAARRYPNSKNRISVIYHGATEISRRKSADGKQGAAVGDQQSATSPTTNNYKRLTNHESSTFVILCVAKFMEHKGQHLLISAFERMLDNHSELVGQVVLRLRGFHNDAEYYEQICSQVAGSSYAGQIQLIPFNPGDSIESIYQVADLVVLLSDYEGFGLPVLEAQGMGLPVVCSNLPVLHEVGGDGCVYVDRDNSDAVSGSLCRFITDSALYALQRQRALENIGRFSWEEAGRRTLDVYATVVEN